MLVGCAMMVLGACGEEDRDGSVVEHFVEVDSAGIAILTTPSSEAFAPLGWQVESVPDLLLGSESTASGYFIRVTGVTTLPEDRILVVDSGRSELLLFDTGGRVLASQGRTGQGPGEFRGPSLVPSASADSVIVFDRSNLRLHVSSPDLQESRTQSLHDWRHGSVLPLGGVGMQVLRDRARFDGGTLEQAMMTEGPVEESRTYFWYDPVSGVERDLASFTAVRWFVSEQHGATTQLGHIPIRRVPIAPEATGTVRSDGALLTNGRRYEVLEFDLSGQLRRILRVGRDPEPMTPEVVEARLEMVLDIYSGADLIRQRAAYAEHPTPDALPAFSALVLDTDGWLWAELYEWDPKEPGTWVVFDPEGRARGTVVRPVGLEIHSVSHNRVLGIWHNEFDEEFVHSYRLHRNDD